MGRSMCGHLLAAGYPATVFNRSPEKARDLVERGAVLADSPRAVAEASDVIFSIVGFPADVRDVTLGPDGALAGAKPGSTLVDMTTSEPALAVEIHREAKAKGVRLGRRPGLRRRRRRRAKPACRSWSGAIREMSDRVLPLFGLMGKTIVHQGGRRLRPAHQDGQPDPDRDQHDRRLRGPPLRPQGGARSGAGAQERRRGSGGLVEPEQPGPPDDRRAIRARVLSSSIS